MPLTKLTLVRARHKFSYAADPRERQKEYKIYRFPSTVRRGSVVTERLEHKWKAKNLDSSY